MYERVGGGGKKERERGIYIYIEREREDISEVLPTWRFSGSRSKVCSALLCASSSA